MSDWLILGARNPYAQVLAPEFLKSHLEQKGLVITIIINIL